MQTSNSAFLQADHIYEEGKGSSKLVAHKPIVHSRLSIFFKRFLDLIISASLLIILIPTLLPIVALLVVIDSKGGVFFIQKRTGLKKQAFHCYKIRTMYRMSQNSNGNAELGITRFGMFLRKTHIDELPQLLNVLLGQMSLVGPRPHMLSDTKEFESQISNYHLRHAVKPGITGLAQVNGFYGSVNDIEHLKKRLQHDIEYVYNWNLAGDIKIMFRTLKEPLVNKD